jgi:hypothetical protein
MAVAAASPAPGPIKFIPCLLLLTWLGLSMHASGTHGSSSSIDLGSLQLCGVRQLAGSGSQASGVAWMHSTNTIWVVTRDPFPALREYSPWPGLSPLRVVPLDGALRDPEGKGVVD